MPVTSIPYSFVILAPIAGEMREAWPGAPLACDFQEPDSLFATLRPSVFIHLPQSLCPAGGIELVVTGKKDFTPDGLLSSQPYLAHLMAAEEFVVEADRCNLSVAEVKQGLKQWPDLPALPDRTRPASETKEKGAQAGSLDNLLAMVSLPQSGTPASPGQTAGYAGLAAQILVHIFADPVFARMESVWQGIQLLARECRVGHDIQMKIVPTDQNTLEDTLAALLPILIREPPSLLLVDLPFGGSFQATQQLARLAEFGQTLLVPVHAWITADFFQVDSWRDVDRLAFLPHHLEQAHFVKWNTVRQSPASRWLSLSCNRFLCRYPFGPDNRSRHIDFKETAIPWLAPVWAVARLVCQRLNRAVWPTGISGRQNLLEDLSLDMTAPHPSPVEKEFSESRLEQLERCGIMALTADRNSDCAYLAGNTMVASDFSLDYKSMITLVTRFVLWCRDNFSETITGRELAAELERAWKRYQDFLQTGYADLPMQVEVSGPEDQPVVHLQWLPSRKVLPAGQQLELEFSW